MIRLKTARNEHLVVLEPVSVVREMILLQNIRLNRHKRVQFLRPLLRLILLLRQLNAHIGILSASHLRIVGNHHEFFLESVLVVRHRTESHSVVAAGWSLFAGLEGGGSKTEAGELVDFFHQYLIKSQRIIIEGLGHPILIINLHSKNSLPSNVFSTVDCTKYFQQLILGLQNKLSFLLSSIVVEQLECEHLGVGVNQRGGVAHKLLDLRTLGEVARPNISLIFTQRQHISLENGIGLVGLVVVVVGLNGLQEVTGCRHHNGDIVDGHVFLNVVD